MTTITIADKFVKIDGKRYPKSSLIPEVSGGKLTIVSGNPILGMPVHVVPFGQVVNGATGQAFASEQALIDFIEADGNFFNGGGDGTGSQLPINSKVVILGDSLTEGTSVTSGNAAVFKSRGFFTFAHLLSGSKLYLPMGGNLGVGGQKTSEMVVRLKPLLDLNPKLVIIEAGTNDVGNSVPYLTIIRNLRLMYDTCIAANAKVIAVTIFPRFGSPALTAPNEVIRKQVNDWIKSQASSDILVVDAEPFANNSSYYWDGLHLSSIGASVIGSLVASAINNIVKKTGSVSSLLTTDNSYNPNLYFNGTGGAKLNGATGTVADSYWLRANDIGATVVGSIYTDSIGNRSQEITVSGSYSGNYKTIDVVLTTNSNMPSSGDLIEAIAEFEIVTNDPNIIGFTMNGQLLTADYQTTLLSISSLLAEDQLSNQLAVGRRYVTRTPPNTVQAGTVGNQSNQFQMILKNTATSTPINAKIRLHKMGLRKVPANLL